MTKTLLSFLFLFFIVQSSQSQVVTENIDFDNYVSSTDNDLSNHFTNGFTSLIATPGSGISGGCLQTPLSNNWGNDNAMYCSKYHAFAGSYYYTTICFKFDTTNIDLSSGERTVSIWLNPQSDWNHYIVANISGSAPKRIQYLAYSSTNLSGPFTLVHGHWYSFLMINIFSGGATNDEILTTIYVDDLGTSGISTPVNISTVSGTINDSAMFNDSAIAVSINGSQWGGAVALDNFIFHGEKSSDSCLTTSIESTGIESNNFTWTINNHILSIVSKTGEISNVDVFNVEGKIIYNSTMSSDFLEADLSKFSDGIYFIKINSDEKIYQSRFFLH